jgi:hypothetical protein
MSSSDGSDLSDRLHFRDRLDGDEYHITFNHTHEGFKVRKDVLSTLRRGNSTRKDGKAKSNRDVDGVQNRGENSSQDQKQQLRQELIDLKQYYVSRKIELDSLQGKMDQLSVEILENSLSPANGTNFNDETLHSQLKKPHVSAHPNEKEAVSAHNSFPIFLTEISLGFIFFPT